MLHFDTKEEALRAVYGYRAFRGVQADAIDAALMSKDSIIVMATGGGKSLCYQIPAFVLGRTAVVVSPLVSLMADQVLALEARGVPAVFLGSAQSDPTVWQRLSTFQFIYITPELASTDRLREALREVQPCLIAIDEAHCVSEWGHDFRPEYRQLRELRGDDSLIPIMAVTATATPQTREDICTNLHLRDPRRLYLGVDRPNLVYTASPVKTFHVLESEVRAASGGSAIVYVSTTRETEELADKLEKALGHPVGAYHAKMDKERREEVHHAFVRDELTTVVATLAFGMGIDKPDVRLVVHYGACKTLESYYQQAGRAGRDGDPARCILLHAAADWPKLHNLLTRDVEQHTAERAVKGLNKMRAYCDLSDGTCRRAALALHFGEENVSHISCGQCDVCNASTRPRVDATNAARAFLKTVQVLDAWYGIGTVIEVCHGTKTPKHARLEELSVFGIGSEHSTHLLQSVSDACRTQGFVSQRMREPRPKVVYAAPELSEAGKAWLENSESTLDISVSDAPLSARKRGRGGSSGSSSSSSVATSSEAMDDPLFEKLRATRWRLAKGLPPYMVCSDATLRELVIRKPQTLQALLAIPGFGRLKVDKYGNDLIAVLQE